VGERPDLRASDQDREAAASEIRERFAQGRLSGDELGERMERACAAQTIGEVQLLPVDLPALPPSARTTRAELAARRSRVRRS